MPHAGSASTAAPTCPGLKLSKDEFESNFFRHRESLLIRQYHGIYEVSGRRNKCPNWEDNQCVVYKTRPIECRIFPYTIGGITRIGRFVLMTYHHRTCCPHKDIVLLPQAEALRLLRSFAKDAFGEKRRRIDPQGCHTLAVCRFPGAPDSKDSSHGLMNLKRRGRLTNWLLARQFAPGCNIKLGPFESRE